MSPARVILFALMVINGTLADGPFSKCCNENNLLLEGCMVTDIAYNGGDRVIVWRSDGMVFDVAFSKINLVPRFSAVIDQSSNNTIRFMVNIGGKQEVVEKIRSSQKKDSIVKIDGKAADACDPKSVPAVIHKLLDLECNSGTQTQSLNLHHVGTLHSNSNNTMIHVGYYRRADGNQTHDVKTIVKAWNEDGEILHAGWYKDSSETVAVTGLWGKDGKQLVLSANSHGHMCFHFRSYDSLDFGIPGVADKFMPECIPANMLFGCPQSFCYTGFVDEFIGMDSDVSLPETRLMVTLTRGTYWNFMLTIDKNLRQRGVRTSFRTTLHSGRFSNDSPSLMNHTVKAAFSVISSGRDFDVFVMDDTSSCVTFGYGTDSHLFTELTCEEMFGNVTNSLKQLTGMFFDAEMSILMYLTENELVSVPVSISAERGSYTFKAIGNKISNTNSQNIDAIFKLNGIVFYKRGQFFWQNSSAESIPTIRHPQHNPNGFISISHCNWSDDEAKDLITKINASGSGYKDLIPTNTTDPHEVAIRGLSRGLIVVSVVLYAISFAASMIITRIINERKKKKSSATSNSLTQVSSDTIANKEEV